MKMRRFGEILKKNRELHGFSTRDMAKVLKVSATLISKWEAGKYPPPNKPEIIRKISRALSLNENELMELSRIENMLNDLPANIREALKRTLYVHLKTNFIDEDGCFKGPESIFNSLVPLTADGRDPSIIKSISGTFKWDQITYSKFKTLEEWVINDFLIQLLCRISIDFKHVKKGYADTRTFLRNTERLYLIEVCYSKPDDTEEIFLLDSEGISVHEFLLI